MSLPLVYLCPGLTASPSGDPTGSASRKHLCTLRHHCHLRALSLVSLLSLLPPPGNSLLFQLSARESLCTHKSDGIMACWGHWADYESTGSPAPDYDEHVTPLHLPVQTSPCTPLLLFWLQLLSIPSTCLPQGLCTCLCEWPKLLPTAAAQLAPPFLSGLKSNIVSSG